MKPFPHKANRGATDTWLTPKPVVDALGPFDLDPCAAPEPRPWPTAARHYDITKGQDGLMLPWKGFIWLNPPFGDQAGVWLGLLGLHAPGGVSLILARCETEWWFKSVWAKAAGMMFLRGRLNFCYPDGTQAKQNCGAPPVLIGYGDEAMRRIANSPLEGHLVLNSPVLIFDGPETWREVIKDVMAGKSLPLRDIYAAAESTRKVRTAQASQVRWREKIRKVLQHHFVRVERGVWAPA